MIDRIVHNQATQAGVEIRDYANVGNHLHILIKAPRRECVSRFLRSITGLLPRRLMGCERGRRLGFQFWDARPFTKIVAEGLRPFREIRMYFVKNRTHTEGFDYWQQPSSA